MTNSPSGRASHAGSWIEGGLLWVVGHAARLWPLLVLPVLLALTWDALRQIHPSAVRATLRGTDPFWLFAASVMTALNVAIMGLYDVVAFRHTRSPWSERWRFGAVAFAWSNFLTLGPLAGPAIRFWLYRPAVERASELQGGIVLVSLAFVSGLVGWLLAVLIAPPDGPVALIGVLAAVLVLTIAFLARTFVQRIERLELPEVTWRSTIGLAAIGWLDWFLAAVAFLACLRATGATALTTAGAVESFFFGQAIGLASLVPGGFGSSDAFWVAHLDVAESVAAASLVVYRAVYYILPWIAASLALLAWATRRGGRRVELARRVLAGLVGGGGVLLVLSAASPTLAARLVLLERYVPLPLVEAGHATAVLTGLLLLVLARGLAKGYRAALRATIIVLTLGGIGAILKGLDWEEAAILGGLALALASQAALFERPSHGGWLERRDLGRVAAALSLFLVFGALTHRVTARTLDRWTRVGYRVEATRFVRSAGYAILAVSIGGLYLVLRVPIRFTRLSSGETDRVLGLHQRIGGGTTALMVANGDKAVFLDDERGLCLYRTVGPYLAILSDPIVRDPAERSAFLDALFLFAAEVDRRPIFYQISLDWIPPLHDRGYAFFKLGEEGHVLLDRLTLEGSAGKLNRQILRRAERDHLTFRIVQPPEVAALLPELTAVSSDWLESKGVRERQFSIGFFDPAYLRRFPCAIVEWHDPTGSSHHIVGFANLLEGPRREELSVDLMRYRSDAPHGVMDFLFLSLMLHGQAQGYRWFNLGMAPLATVGEARGAHLRERLAHLLFQHGEHWYKFQGLRQYKEKFEPHWVPRYMAYQNAWEWPAVITHVSALIAGGWTTILLPAARQRPQTEAPCREDSAGH